MNHRAVKLAYLLVLASLLLAMGLLLLGKSGKGLVLVQLGYYAAVWMVVIYMGLLFSKR